MRLSVFLLLLILLSGCAIHPLGLSTAEWEAMTPAGQQQARAEQAAIDAERRRVREERQRQQQEAEQERAALRHNAAYGEVVECRLTQAQARMARREWHSVKDVAFAIHRDEPARRITLVQIDRPTRSQQVQVSFDGLNVRLCEWYDRHCTQLAGSERLFARGLSQVVQVNGLLEGQLECSFPRRHSFSRPH